MLRLDTLVRVGPPRRKTSVPGRIAAALSVWRQRRQLARLDAALLDDLGLSERQALEEAARPIWDAPDHWKA